MNSRNVPDSLAAVRAKGEPGTSPAESMPDPLATSAQRRVRVGKPVQFWMHDEDRRILRELSAWLAGQGVRASDSLVIRSALRFTQTGAEFLEAYRQAAQLDGRLKRSSGPTNRDG